MTNLIKPNFFIVGAPKSGTTALCRYLAAHSHVFFSAPKELQYFASDFKRRLISTEKDYLNMFQNADPLRHLAIGEGTTIYMFSKIALFNILQFQPAAKFVIMLRNPVDLVRSFHLEMCDTGIETTTSFINAWNLESERRLGRKIPKFCVDEKYLLYSEWGRLGTQLQRALTVARREHFKIIIFDDFIANTALVYQETLEFLGLPKDSRTSFPKINERRYTRSVSMSRLLGFVLRLWLPLRLKMRFNGWGLGEKLKTWNSYQPAKNADEKETRAMLTRFYANEITLLEKILERDLSCWLEVN